MPGLLVLSAFCRTLFHTDVARFPGFARGMRLKAVDKHRKAKLKQNPVASDDELYDIQRELGGEAAKEFGKGGTGEGLGRLWHNTKCLAGGRWWT